MPKCLKIDCEKQASKALKLRFRATPDGESATAYIALLVCDDIHMPEHEVKEFIGLNFAAFCVGFEEIGKMRPDIALTEFEWVPLAEAEKNWQEGLDEARRRGEKK